MQSDQYCDSYEYTYEQRYPRSRETKGWKAVRGQYTGTSTHLVPHRANTHLRQLLTYLGLLPAPAFFL